METDDACSCYLEDLGYVCGDAGRSVQVVVQDMERFYGKKVSDICEEATLGELLDAWNQSIQTSFDL